MFWCSKLEIRDEKKKEKQERKKRKGVRQNKNEK